MARCNGNPFKQWPEDRHSQSLIACVSTEEDSESGTARNGSTGAEQSRSNSKVLRKFFGSPAEEGWKRR